MKPNQITVKKVGNFLPWLPVTASLALMMMISLISAVSFSKLKTSNFWREHTYEVLATAQTFFSDLFSIQGDARNYLFTGQSAALKSFQDSVNNAPSQLTQLKLLTRDNRGQEELLRSIGSDLDEVIAYSQQLVDTRNTHGIQAAVQFESNGHRMASINRTLADLQAFTDEEHRLLSQRSANAQVDFHNMKRLLISGSILAGLFLLLANFMTSHAMARQKELTLAAQAAELAKSEFLAIMSHEIRTPMN